MRHVSSYWLLCAQIYTKYFVGYWISVWRNKTKPGECMKRNEWKSPWKLFGKKLNNIDWFSWWKVCIQPKFIVYNDETDDGDTIRRIMLDRAGDKSKWERHFWLLTREKENVCVTKSKREFQHFKWHVFCCHHCWFITILSLTKAREWAWHIHSPTLYYESPQHLCAINNALYILDGTINSLVNVLNEHTYICMYFCR